MLLIVPGVIKAYEYAMVPFLIIKRKDKLDEPFDYCITSKELMDGYKMKLFLFDLIFGLIYIILVAAGAYTVIGLLFVVVMQVPLKSIFYVKFYNAIANEELNE